MQSIYFVVPLPWRNAAQNGRDEVGQKICARWTGGVALKVHRQRLLRTIRASASLLRTRSPISSPACATRRATPAWRRHRPYQCLAVVALLAASGRQPEAALLAASGRQPKAGPARREGAPPIDDQAATARQPGAAPAHREGAWPTDDRGAPIQARSAEMATKSYPMSLGPSRGSRPRAFRGGTNCATAWLERARRADRHATCY